jgi:hypothetical protein
MTKLQAVVVVVVMALLISSASGGAQDLRVRLLDQETREPLGGLLVAALDRAGAIGTTTLSSADGLATVRIGGTSPHRLLIRRIGFTPVTTDTLAIAAPGTTLDIVVPAHRIVLGTVHVVGNQVCANQTLSPSTGAEPAWTQVRAALEASTLTRDQRLVTTAAFRFQRDLRVDGKVNYADTALRGRSGERPFVAPAPAVLERDGYFKHHDDGSENFYAPDEAVLLSPGFTQHHCVTEYADVRRDSAGAQIALAFMPRDRDTRPEIKGLIWIDSATSELRRIDFEYVRISLAAPADSIGGSVSFAHLTSGAWIVSRWALRMPRFRTVDRRTNYAVLDGYIEVGGTARVTSDVSIPGPNVPRVIVGSVFDSLTNRPLSGAHVQIADLGRDVTADSLGRFRFDSVAAGVHVLYVDHHALDDVGLFSIGARVDAIPQITSTVAIATPSFATLWNRACGGAAMAGAQDGFVFGIVRDSGLTAQDSTAIIEVAWRDTTRKTGAGSHATARADSSGAYAICGVPATQTVAVTATHAHIATLPVSLRLGPARVARRDFTIASKSTATTAIADMAPVEFSKPDAASGASTKAVTVKVQSLEGKPIVYANVTVNGGATTITNENGEVAFGNGMPHVFSLRVKRIGFSEWYGNVAIPDSASTVMITLAHIAQQLGAVRVTGQKNPVSPFVQGFYDRWMMRQKGLVTGMFFGPEELEFRHPDLVTTMLRGLNGVCFSPPTSDVTKLVVNASHFASLTPNLGCPNCPMAIVIDGMQQYPPPNGNVYIDVLVNVNEVMAIEVYPRAGNMPISLQVNDTKCGVLAVWTGPRH